MRALEWTGRSLRVLDQRQLPQREVWLELRTPEEVAEAIREMALRGAPLIGLAAAFGAALGARRGDLEGALRVLERTRPTARNLFWALERVAAAVDPEAEALRMWEEELAAERTMAQLGATLLEGEVLTICNTGWLAAPGVGTALGAIREAFRRGRITRVWACETRPLLQGARLTAWELQRDGIPCTLLCEGALGALLARGRVKAAVVGADRICANGDTANKVGTYTLAVLSARHGVPLYVVAPASTVDLGLAKGTQVPLEERSSEEVLTLSGVALAPAGAEAWNPAFDVTPGELIGAIITERGVAWPPFEQSLARAVAGGSCLP